MFPAGNTRSKSGSATPNNTPAKARGKSSDGGSVGKMMSALALRSSSPESDESEETVNTVSLKRQELFSFLGKHPNAHKDPHLHDQFCGLLEEFTKAEEEVSPSDPIFH